MMKRWNKEIPIHDAIASRRCESTWQESLHELPAALQGTLCEQFGAPFAMAMLAWLRDLPAAPSPVSIHYTFLEIAYHWAYSRANLLPRPDPRRPNTWSPSTAVHGPHTLAAVLRLVKHFFTRISVLTPLISDRVSLLGCGVFPPQRGISLVIGSETVNHVWNLLGHYTSRRPIRKANDLARPVV